MSTYKEFQGKTLDEAIKEACHYFGVEREKLEIEIVNDAKGGIFGLVGTKKASIRAARVQLQGISSLLEEDGPSGNGAPQSEAEEKNRGGKPRESRGREERNGDRRPEKKKSEDKTVEDKNSEDRKSASSAQESHKERQGQEGGRSRGRGENHKAPREKAFSDGAMQPGAAPRGAGRAAGASRIDEHGDINGNVCEPEVLPRNHGDRKDAPRERGGMQASGRPDRGPAPQKRERGDRPQGQRQFVAPAAENAGTNGRPAANRLRDDVSERIAASKAAGSVKRRDDDDGVREELPAIELETCDQEKLFTLIRETVTQLVSPIVGEMTCTVAIVGSRVRVTIDCGESSGLLVGREGQTLASVQYIAGRIIAKALGGTVRLQFDAGNYRERQDERLRELALTLAEKVKTSHRSFSTRPLSAYQRRIVHLALEQDPQVQTFSKGEGIQRRVVIQLRRGDAVVAEDVEPVLADDAEHDAFDAYGPNSATDILKDDES